MKKLFSLVVLATIMLVGLAGNALAFFETGNLIRAVYQDNGDIEVVSDLGSWSSLGNASNAKVGSAFSLSQFSDATYSNLNVAYFVQTSRTNKSAPAYLSGSKLVGGQSDVAPVSTPRNDATLMGVLTFISSNYSVYGTDSVAASKADLESYWMKADNGGVGGYIGRFKGFYSTSSFGEANLADLATVGYVDQNLYMFTNPSVVGAGVAVATIRTLADGTTLINPAATNPVPVPASLLLFGSGLLGLFGIRRKNA